MVKFNLNDLVNLIPQAFLPEKAGDLDVKIGIQAEGDGGGAWVINIKNGTCQVNPGMVNETDLFVSSSMETIKNIFTGQDDPMKAFMKGDIQLKGSMGLAMKLSGMFKADRELFKDFL